MREREHCYLTVCVATVTYRSLMLLLPIVRFATATYRLLMLLPAVCLCCCYLPFALLLSTDRAG
ncbi:hypothetical protein KJR02_04080 [Methanimicrococcus blatticola]|nr:hypothetical protein [Methanimicrococcus blatticola]